MPTNSPEWLLVGICPIRPIRVRPQKRGASVNSIDPYYRLRAPAPTEEADLCHCPDDQRSLKLMPALSCNPIHCVTCNLEIPPQAISLPGRLVDPIASWASIYDAIDRLWLDSAEYEAWALSELTDINSALNKRGFQLLKSLSEWRSCFYWWFQDNANSNWRPPTTCPLCNSALKEVYSKVFRHVACQSCHIITTGE